MYFYKTFAEYHYRRAIRKEKVKLLCYAVGICIVCVGLILLCAFIGSL